MPPTLVSLSDLKAYLGVTGSQDDVRIASAASNASIMAERDTGRVFAVSSNVTRRYSTDGQASLTIHDRPYSDSSRVVTLGGVVQTMDTNYWLLPDRRNGDISTTIQLRHFDTSRGDWYKGYSNWFDANLDSPRYLASGAPNDLVIVGVEGHPTLPADVYQGVLELAAYLYWKERGGASGFVNTITDEVELSTAYPESYQRMVRNWRIRTAVSLI